MKHTCTSGCLGLQDLLKSIERHYVWSPLIRLPKIMHRTPLEVPPLKPGALWSLCRCRNFLGDCESRSTRRVKHEHHENLGEQKMGSYPLVI